jgi:Saxitoxin biosynthesis operon protein SxtJ
LAVAIRPAILAPLNRLWFKLGMLLGRVTNPVVMGIIFFLVVTPAAFVLRLMGKDPRRRKFDPAAPSYWIERKPPGPGL